MKIIDEGIEDTERSIKRRIFWYKVFRVFLWIWLVTGSFDVLSALADGKGAVAWVRIIILGITWFALTQVFSKIEGLNKLKGINQ